MSQKDSPKKKTKKTARTEFATQERLAYNTHVCVRQVGVLLCGGGSLNFQRTSGSGYLKSRIMVIYIYITANLFDFMMMMMMTNLSYIVTWNCIRVYGVKGEPICLNCLSVENYFLLCILLLRGVFSDL
jgi:hypothetical protein